jgi:hypothetical protein
MRPFIFISVFVVIATAIGCNEQNLLHPYGADDGHAPGNVSMTSYEQLPGGVSITFNSPDDLDLLYIKAKYTLDTGKEMEQRASTYSNKLEIRGWGNTDVKKVTLSAVDRFENEGLAKTYDVVPGTPPYIEAFRSLTTLTTFGGIGINLQNADMGELVIDVETQDSIGDWYSVHTEYTRRSDIQFAIRGFDTIPREFRITVRDPWYNTSDVYSTSITPYFVKQLERNKFRRVILPGDLSVSEWGFQMEMIWDGQTDGWSMCHSNNFENFPVWFTFDMGVTAKLAYYIYWSRVEGGNFSFQHNNPNKWELWGYDGDYPPTDGSWTGWVKLIDCESIKPSGLPVGQQTQEDIDYAARGETFEFPIDAPPARYIRFKALSTFTGNHAIHFDEIWFFGQEIP